jgi:hypothetical protein
MREGAHDADFRSTVTQGTARAVKSADALQMNDRDQVRLWPVLLLAVAMGIALGFAALGFLL